MKDLDEVAVAMACDHAKEVLENRFFSLSRVKSDPVYFKYTPAPVLEMLKKHLQFHTVRISVPVCDAHPTGTRWVTVFGYEPVREALKFLNVKVEKYTHTLIRLNRRTTSDYNKGEQS
jgi:hypothetical protein